ncbi:DUF4191 domain-containing protein [Nocardioides acrostichi]|uniref:DUF4191 domain-containing protein n=1 Tax=Nocardioides acrostichi TaxID=2784339 RepID=A0A930YDB3_9ACTN|nr:DUF4191 domain-containing protein [Nocardioides acrostichi]MBF4162309.1 DUF4191 domain-containing protein [Nocardioides acrostichi]
MAKKDAAQSAGKPAKTSRTKQLIESYRITKERDPKIGLWVAGTFVLAAALGFVLFHLVGGSGVLGIVVSIIGAVLFGTLGALIVFGRRAQRSAYDSMEGQVGAAAAALNMLRRGWNVTPAVAFTKQQDVVHRVVGPPGIVLVGEGHAGRVKSLLVSERKKHERVAYEVPISEVVCGREEGQVPLPKLMRHLQKMKRQLKPADMTDVLNRLKALDANRSAVPLPKGPMPTSMKGMRSQMRGR